jgi:hypothetical protein
VLLRYIVTMDRASVPRETVTPRGRGRLKIVRILQQTERSE